MPTRQQVRARQHAQRRQLPAAAAAPAAIEAAGRYTAGLRVFRDACDAYRTETQALLDYEAEAVSEVWADANRKVAAIRADVAEKWAVKVAAYEKRTADSHQPEPDGSDEPDDAGEPDVDR